jgi:glycosyltransferase involved in cell wall biosynthesis
MKPLGGTELLKEKLVSLLEPNILNNINLIATTCSFDLLDKNKINVLWQHLGPKQQAVQYMGDRMFVDSVDYFVYVSHWQYNQFRNVFNIPDHKSLVIKNAIDPIEYISRNNKKVKLMYTTVPWRGLVILLKVIDILNQERDDFELHVYSSTKIYGDEFEKQAQGQFDELFEKCKNTKNVVYKGYASNETIRQELINTDILTYPCIEEETSCLSVIEAMMAGCHVLTTNYGALPETCADFATLVEIDSSGYNLINKYAKQLNNLIDKAKDGTLQEYKTNQVDYYKKFYTWESRIKQWKNFIESCI